MPLFYQHNINEHTRLAIWKIEEPENFFLQHVPLQKEITHPHKRLQHLAGRYLLTFLFPGFPYDEILIADTRKPYLPYEQYHFSVSHCGNYAAAIVSTNLRTAIDIEIASEKVLNISHKFLNENEKKFVAQAVNKLATATIFWAAKESVFKWWSYGIVDFSKHILLQTAANENKGNIEAIFLREPENFSLQLQYKVFDELCLVWLCTAE